MTRTSLRFVCAALPLLFSCTAKTLDGGSTASGSSSGGTDAPASGVPGDGSMSQNGTASTPLSGFVMGKPFAPTAFELRPETKSSFWRLEVHNASEPCARGRRMGDDVVMVTVRRVAGEGSWPLEPEEVSMQRGFYMVNDPKEPQTDFATMGSLVLEAPPGETGTTVQGRLWVKGETSELNGTFTATVCESR